MAYYNKTVQKAVDKYVKGHYDSIILRVPAGRKTDIQAYCKKHGESVNGLLCRLIRVEIGMNEDEWKLHNDIQKSDQ